MASNSETKSQKRKLVPGKIVFSPNEPDPHEIALDLQSILQDLKENPAFDDFEKQLVAGMIQNYETASDKLNDIVRNVSPDLTDQLGPYHMQHFAAQMRRVAYAETANRIVKAQKRFNRYIDLPHIRKAREELTMQLSWLHDKRIYNAAGRYFSFINFTFNQAPINIKKHQKINIDQTLKGAKYKPRNSKNAYTMAMVETTPEFWATATKQLPKRNGKVISERRGQQILRGFVDCLLFDHIKIGPRNWAVIVGYYMPGPTGGYYKKPLAVKRACAHRLAKFDF